MDRTKWWLGLAAGLSLLTGGCLNGNPKGAQTHILEGDAALSAKNLDKALAEFKEAVRLDPKMAEAHAKLGTAYKQKGDLNSAADSLETAVRLDPFKFEPVFELGEVYRLLNKMTQAVRAYSMACEVKPDDFDAHFRLATCYQMTTDLEKASAAYKEAIKIDPKNAHAWSNLGAVFDAQGKHYDAINAYKQSLECNTQQPVVLVNLATSYLNQERWATARKTLQIALKMDPKLSVAHERMGYCFWREQSLDEASQSYLRAINLDSQNAAAYAGYGIVRMTQYLNAPEKSDLLQEAVEAWHRSLEIQPDQPKLKNLLEKYRPKNSRPLIGPEQEED